MDNLIIMFTVLSMYVGPVAAYLTESFTDSYLLEARFLSQFASAVITMLVAETLLSFYYPFNNIIAIFYIAGLGLLLNAASMIFLGGLNNRWKGKMFRIA